MKAYLFGLAFATAAFLVRCLLYLGGYAVPESLQYIIFMHLLFILLSVFTAIKKGNTFSNSDQGLKENLKLGLKGGLSYSVLTALGVYIYFSWIDVHYFNLKQEQIIQGAMAEGVANVEQLKSSVKSFFTVGNWTSLTLLSFSVVAFIYALLLSLFQQWSQRMLSK